MNLEERVLALLAECCGTREAAQPGTDLLERDLLDSLAFIDLLEGLEDMGIELQPTRLPRDAFRTPESILALCRAAAGETENQNRNHLTI